MKNERLLVTNELMHEKYVNKDHISIIKAYTGQVLSNSLKENCSDMHNDSEYFNTKNLKMHSLFVSSCIPLFISYP